jgi:succinyl-CoA synthetase beta subunit
MTRGLRITAALVLACLVSACTYYVAPGSQPASFDRSFGAASNALVDQGFSIVTQDRASGTVVGNGYGGTATVRVMSQADGSVRVQFDGSGLRDPGVLDRVSRSYDARMGR